MLYLHVKYLGQPLVFSNRHNTTCVKGKTKKGNAVFFFYDCAVVLMLENCTRFVPTVTRSVVCSFFEEVDNLCGLEFAAMHRPQWAEK